MLLVAFLSFIGMQAFAQTTITGTVTDANGEPVPGATVSAKGFSNVGTITDLNGSYSLSVPADATSLIFSFVGMKKQEVEIGGRATINVTLENEDVGLEEVVVTALGLEVSKDKLTGAVTSVDADLVKNSGESGVIQGLAAKTSGIRVVKNTGDPGAGAYLQIRGQNTITGSTQPLIIVDGIPVINSSRGGGTDGVVQQSRLNDLNPDDIEKIDVLKGAAAAAVWGTRAANGVIVITTKSGKGKPKGASVDLNMGFSFDQVSIEHPKQDKFGQGINGAFVANRGESWGDKIADRAGGADDVDMTGEYFEAEDGTKYYPIITKNSKEVYNDSNRDQVFRNGFSSDLSAGINFNSEKSNTYLSLADWNQKGVINGNSDYRRSTVRMNYKVNPNDKISFKVNTMYAYISSNRIQQGSNLNGLYLGYLRTSPDFDNSDYKGTYYDAAGVAHFNAHRSYRRYLGDRPPTYNNPGWTINEQVNTSDVQRIMINPTFMWDMVNKDNWASTLTVRNGNDISVDKRITFFPVNSAASYSSGSYNEQWLIETEHQFEVFTRNVHNFSSMNFSWILGGQYNIRNYNFHGGIMSNFINPADQIYDYANSTADNKTPSNYQSHKYLGAAYVVLNFDLLDQIYIELTGRSEKSNSFGDVIFYPSASVAWQFTQTVMPENNILTFGKLRAAYGTVGIEPPLYIGGTDFISGSVGDGWGSYLDASYYGGGLQQSTVQGNPNIEPERKTEFEVGADMRFIKDALSLNVTYYENKTEGVIFAVDVPASTGYTSKWENAATISNKGWEVDLTGAVVNTNDFKFNLLLNYTRIRNNVDDLKGVQSIFLNGFTGTSSRAVEGHALGTLWGGMWLRDDAGNLELDANGFPQAAPEEGILGDPNPDFSAGLGANFSYKGISLNVLFETSQGGDMWAGTYGVLNHFGIHPNTANEVTLANDITAYDGTVYQAGETVRGNIENFGSGDVLLNEAWYKSVGGGFGPVGEQFVFDASFIRLREVSLAYSFPKSLASKMKMSHLDISLIGRNLALWSEFADKYGVDPETNLTGVSNGRGLDYFTNPSTRSFLIKLSIGF